MKILKITQKNIKQYRSDLISLNDQFLVDLNISKQRTQEQKEAIIRNMIKPDSPTHLLIGLPSVGQQAGLPSVAQQAGISQQQAAIGMVYFNVGTGYSCGGDYVCNSMFIVKEERSKGRGTAFLAYIEDWANNKGGVTLLVSSRDITNVHSEKLFKKMGYQQSENIWIAKKL